MRRFLILICLLFLALPSFAQEEQAQEPTSLLQIHYAFDTIDSLEARGILSHEAAETERAYYLAAAETLTGESLSREEIAVRAFESAGSSIFRFLNFVNIIWALAGLMLVISLAWIYILFIARFVPIFIYELIAYCVAVTFIYNGQFASAGTAQFVALPGVLGLGILLPFSYIWHFALGSKKFSLYGLASVFLLLSVIWGLVAIDYGSELIAFLAIVAGITALALTRILAHLTSSMIIEAMIVCFGLLAVYLIAEISVVLGVFSIFGFGTYWIGSTGYFAALEVMASKWRGSRELRVYLFWQVFALLSALLGLFSGVFWQIDNLSETAGTFLLIYTLTKYLEIPNLRKHWAWAALGLAILLYTFGYLINTYPAFFLLG